MLKHKPRSKNISQKQMAAEMKRWISSLEFDVQPLVQTAFQELLIIIILGTVGTTVDHYYLSVPNDKGDDGCTTLMCRNKCKAFASLIKSFKKMDCVDSLLSKN